MSYFPDVLDIKVSQVARYEPLVLFCWDHFTWRFLIELKLQLKRRNNFNIYSQFSSCLFIFISFFYCCSEDTLWHVQKFF
jgi:hypothetical protein